MPLVRVPTSTVSDRWRRSDAVIDPRQGHESDRQATTATDSSPLAEVVTVVATPGLWTVAVSMAPAAPARGVVLAAGWLVIAGVLERRRRPT